MSREELIKTIEFYIEDEKKAQKKYEELLEELILRFGNCPLPEMFDLLMMIRLMSNDELRHSLVLSRLRCVV